jgi:hypothetical protein
VKHILAAIRAAGTAAIADEQLVGSHRQVRARI